MAAYDTSLQPFWEHVEDLRKLFLRCLLTILIAASIGFFFSDRVIHYMKMAIPASPSSALDFQPMEFEKIINRSSLLRKVALSPEAELRYSSTAVEYSEGSILLPPNAYIEIVKPKNSSLFILSPIEGLTTSLKIAFWLGILISAPI